MLGPLIAISAQAPHESLVTITGCARPALAERPEPEAAPQAYLDRVRNPTNGPVTVIQESTNHPGTTWRWLGSSAMDNAGDIAVGFSRPSSSTVYPAMRYAGRLSSDPINSMAQGEATMFAGAGSQSSTGNRWGDYSAMSVDPEDDCTFW